MSKINVQNNTNITAQNTHHSSSKMSGENNVANAEVDPAQNKIDGLDSADGLKGKNSRMSHSSEKLLFDDKKKLEELPPIHVKRSKRYLQKFRYYFCHPYMRILVAYGVTFCNFFIYAEDPVAHSFSECTIPVIGNDYAFVVTRYPPNGFSALKVFLYLVAIVTGMVVGKLLVHRLLLRRCFKLSMFQNDQGSWMIMFLVTIISLLIFSLIYNGFLGLDDVHGVPYKISSKMGITNHTFMKAAALGTWMGDFITAWMVTDMMLQEVSKYPEWAKPVRTWWNKGWNRVILFWTVLVVLTAIVASAIISDYIRWDSLNRDFIHTSELGRGFLASFILVMDFTIVMQDWDFPMFNTNLDIKLPGINTAYIQFKIPDCLRKEHWTVHIAGKWFNYGILLIVMLLDLNMWKNQIFYKPFDYGQYVGPNGKVYSVTDRAFVESANTTLLSYAWRWSHPSVNNSYGSRDPIVNSRYRGYSLAVTGTAFIPCLLTFVVFGSLIWIFGRSQKVDDVEPISLKPKSSLRRVTGISIKKEKDAVDAAEDDGSEEEKNAEDCGAPESKAPIGTGVSAKAGYGTINDVEDTEKVAYV